MSITLHPEHQEGQSNIYQKPLIRVKGAFKVCMVKFLYASGIVYHVAQFNLFCCNSENNRKYVNYRIVMLKRPFWSAKGDRKLSENSCCAVARKSGPPCSARPMVKVSQTQKQFAFWLENVENGKSLPTIIACAGKL